LISVSESSGEMKQRESEREEQISNTFFLSFSLKYDSFLMNDILVVDPQEMQRREREICFEENE
jgi:hypothetical protein